MWSLGELVLKNGESGDLVGQFSVPTLPSPGRYAATSLAQRKTEQLASLESECEAKPFDELVGLQRVSHRSDALYVRELIGFQPSSSKGRRSKSSGLQKLRPRAKGMRFDSGRECQFFLCLRHSVPDPMEDQAC